MNVRFAIGMALLIVLMPSAAEASNFWTIFDLEGVGATGLRYRINGATEWTLAGSGDGYADIPPDDGEIETIEVEWLGVPYGRTTFTAEQISGADGDVTFSLGPLQYGPDGVFRAVDRYEIGEGSSTISQAFQRSIGQVFGVPDMIAMVRVEYLARSGVYLRGVCGAVLLFLIIRRFLEWTRACVGEIRTPKVRREWEAGRRKGDMLLSNLHAEKEVAEYDRWDREADLRLADDDYLGYEGRV